MKSYARHQVILDRIANGDTVLIDELVCATGASPSTVRRDIRALEDLGQVVSLRGGAIRAEERSSELPAAAKSLINREQKIAIARAAAAVVRDGETIYVDSGTTATEFMFALRGVRVHVITSNTQVLAVAPDSKATITALGGDYLPEIGSIAGAMTDRQLEDLYFDRAFIGTTGVDEEAGITTFDIREANKKRIVQMHSRDTYVLADSTKLGRVSLCRAFPIARATIVTDASDPSLDAAGGVIIAGR